MSLRALAESDLGTILEDGVTGFGWPITITDPEGRTASLTGFSDDIEQLIDPDTGQYVSGRLASVALRISSVIAAQFSMPEEVTDPKCKPWVVVFDDINGVSHTFKIQKSNPDRALGIVTCILEAYQAS